MVGFVEKTMKASDQVSREGLFTAKLLFGVKGPGIYTNTSDVTLYAKRTQVLNRKFSVEAELEQETVVHNILTVLV